MYRTHSLPEDADAAPQVVLHRYLYYRSDDETIVRPNYVSGEERQLI